MIQLQAQPTQKVQILELDEASVLESLKPCPHGKIIKLNCCQCLLDYMDKLDEEREAEGK